MSKTKSTKTKLTIEHHQQQQQQIPMNAVLEMVQRMAGIPPPPYEPRNRGTKAARAANRKKKALNLPVTPPTPAPSTTSKRRATSSKPTRTITSASIHVDRNSDPANPAMSLEFTFGQAQDEATAAISCPVNGTRNRHRDKVSASAEATDPTLKENGLAQSKPKPRKDEPATDDASFEREAEKIWERIKAKPLCHCRKERILDKLRKHKENLQHVNDLLKARVMAYQAFGDQLTAELDSRDLGIVLVVTETPDGKADMKFKIEKKPDEGK